MIQKDYILRMIEQMGKILAKVLFNKNQGEQEKALWEIENGFSMTLGINPLLLDSLSNESVAEMLGISKDTDAGSLKCIMAGRLLKEKADILLKGKHDKSIEYYGKALYLYLVGMQNLGYTEVDVSSYYSDIQDLEQKLGVWISPHETSLLLQFYSARGR